MLALILTILLECAALFAMGERSPIFYVYWIAVTTLTNVPANLYVNLVFSGGRLGLALVIAVIEALVFLSEFLLCLAYTRDKKISAKYSAVCNVTSFGIGSLIVLLFFH